MSTTTFKDLQKSNLGKIALAIILLAIIIFFILYSWNAILILLSIYVIFNFSDIFLYCITIWFYLMDTNIYPINPSSCITATNSVFDYYKSAFNKLFTQFISSSFDVFKINSLLEIIFSDFSHKLGFQGCFRHNVSFANHAIY